MVALKTFWFLIFLSFQNLKNQKLKKLAERNIFSMMVSHGTFGSL